MSKQTRSRRNRATAIALFALTLGLSTSAGSPQAHAQLACADRPAIVRLLQETFTETPTALGLGQDGRMYEVFVAVDGGTWTIVATTPDGETCILIEGKHWVERTPPVAGLESSWQH